MSKSKRLMELMMTVNRKRKFTVKELADEFGVSSRTILRDLQELSELGVPLYSEVGPHGGYQVLNERVLPPIAFTEEEAVSIFFASHALRHYEFLPFETEASSALGKFYHYMSSDVRDRIDQMKNRVDFVTPARQSAFPYLGLLLEGAIRQQVLRIEYESRRGVSTCRQIQPVGIFASGGLWYCPAYCFERRDFRMFRCDRIAAAEAAEGPGAPAPLDLRHIHLGNWEEHLGRKPALLDCVVELSRLGVEACEGQLIHRRLKLHVREDGSGRLVGPIPASELPYLSAFFIGLGQDATVLGPPELLDTMRRTLTELLEKYS
ncbi:YafY family transcriptional regulator [Paenibacillus timonensis]|uniref:Helix-turn-helix transcriptional regulator n=1 Tax=Paenibacillus timonensis TaxID=225915 RepID=A0ABW3SBW8_9BACL|nr:MULTISPECIES: YafY family protein [Paenibacillus]MCH1640231.1 YafY family transcriptional regulator [Paenibacillus timonensis]MDU2240652.1 YafY family protein [Paenibacillus sp.]GJM84004.1 DeoR family transcriptional regulator [Paenibacillus sp. HMSSN-139]